LRAWKLYPNEEGTAFGLGTVYEQLGDFPQALAWYRQALAIEPGHRGAHQNLCRLLIGLAEWQEAEAACRGGLRVAPAEPNLWKGLALAWQQLGREDQAREAFLIAARLDPQDLAVRKLAAGEGRSSTDLGERP
jgi:Flp pilus assembly protein TadD